MFGASQIVEANSYRSQTNSQGVIASRDSSADRFERGTIRRIEAKEHVFCDGDPRTHVFRIEEGVVALSKLLGDGRRQIIEFAYPGDYIGLGNYARTYLRRAGDMRSESEMPFCLDSGTGSRSGRRIGSETL